MKQVKEKLNGIYNKYSLLNRIQRMKRAYIGQTRRVCSIGISGRRKLRCIGFRTILAA